VDADNTDDYVILWPSNHLITSTGTSETVSQGAYPASSVNINDADDLTTDKKGGPAADLNLKNMNLAGPAGEDKDIREKESDSGFITGDDTAKSLDIGSGLATPAFGNVWYDEDKAIGGQSNYCSAGACLFGPGVRVFFTLKYSGDGDGLTFALISAGDTSINTADSVGGDIELSELIGFGGSSLIDTNGPVFLDGSGDGLQPPKIALEFDTLTNNANIDYCLDANTLNQDTRNDPLTDDKDALQYVFWGRRNNLNIPCRNNDPTYDDNRHDADAESRELIWEFQTNEGETIDPIAYGRPVFGSDGAIHVATNGQNSSEAKIHAIRPDGTLKWEYPLGDETKYSPGINPTVPGVTDPYDDDVYSDVINNKLVAIKSDGSWRWETTGVDNDIDCQPLVTADGTIYFGDDDMDLYSYDDTGSQNWTFDTNVAGEIDVIPALAPGGEIYFVANEDGLIAFQTDPENPTSNPTFLWKRTEVLAIDDIGASGTEDWGELNSSPVIDDNGFIYVGDDDGNVYSFFSTGGPPRWTYPTGDNVDSTPYVDPVSGIIYVGSNDKKVHAIDAFFGFSVPGWPFDTSAQGLGFGGKVRSSPIVDSDGTIYVGSDDYLLYAINPDGTLRWSYQTDGRVKSSPGIGPDGIIYVGDTAGKVYALSRFARPRNEKNLMITSEGTSPNFTVGGEPVELDDADGNDWLAGKDLAKGPWAVRMEIKRSLTANANGRYEYTLRTWIRQCDTMIASSECTDPDIIGTFFQDTRLEYEAKPPHLEQTIELEQTDQDLFDRFLFGFTGASGDTSIAGKTPQNAVIEKLQLSFIRPGDPVVTTDPNW
jgi:outer membrane protein assembly factor BamB